jgi:hypothetical protein
MASSNLMMVAFCDRGEIWCERSGKEKPRLCRRKLAQNFYDSLILICLFPSVQSIRKEQ